MSAAVSPQDVRTYANLPGEVPDTLLDEHIAIVGRDLDGDTGLTAAPAGMENAWAEAIIVRALASAFPWLNTFALQGASKVGRLEGAVEFRFLGPDEVDQRVKALTARYDDLVAAILSGLPADDDSDAVTYGAVSMLAI